MFTIGKTVWIIFQLLIGYNLVLPVLFYLIYLFSNKKKGTIQKQPQQEADYAIIVTAYEYTGMLPSVINSLLHVNYPHFLIYVVADKCDISDLHFEDERVILLQPPEVLASNTKSHFYAIRHFKRRHDRLTIIDSDNLVDAEYLNQLNLFFDAGFLAVQGQRKARNLNTTLACLDAARDLYYHYYDGKVLFQIGSSATLAGSGMAFTVPLYRECLEHLDIQGAGFDKVLQAAIVDRGHRIAYAPDAIVFDEKTSYPGQLVKQRARWINTWFRYFRFGFSMIYNGITHLSRNRFLFGLVLLRPPLFIFLLLSIACLLVSIFIAPLTALVWLAGLFLFVTGFLIALLNSDTDTRIYKSLKNIPGFVFYQVVSLYKVRKANRYSVSTPHMQDLKKKA